MCSVIDSTFWISLFGQRGKYHYTSNRIKTRTSVVKYHVLLFENCGYNDTKPRKKMREKKERERNCTVTIHGHLRERNRKKGVKEQ